MLDQFCKSSYRVGQSINATGSSRYTDHSSQGGVVVASGRAAHDVWTIGARSASRVIPADPKSRTLLACPISTSAISNFRSQFFRCSNITSTLHRRRGGTLAWRTIVSCWTATPRSTGSQYLGIRMLTTLHQGHAIPGWMHEECESRRADLPTALATALSAALRNAEHYPS
jgi:hypothetical protein